MAESVDTTFVVGGRKVAARLCLPGTAAAGPVPGVVLVDGSGPTDRFNFEVEQGWLAEAGLASLAYDKPGCGSTPGDWRCQTFADRAAEAASAVDHLIEHPAIAPDRIGLWGASQGGWVVPLAAGRHHRIAFTILVSTPAVTPYEQEAASLVQRMRAAGEPDDAIMRASAVQDELVEMLRGGNRGEAVAARYRRRAIDPAVAYVHKELFADPAGADFAAGIGDHDPVPALEGLRSPVLAVFGARDTSIPVAESVRFMTDAFTRGSNDDVTVVVLPDADHWLRTSADGGLHPDYVPTMTTWLRPRVGLT